MPDISSSSIPAAQLPKLTRKEQLARYRQRVRSAQAFRKAEDLDETWRRMVDLYRGRHWKSKSQEDQVTVNLAFSTINVIAPSVSINHPKISVNARQEEHSDQATITEAVINYWWRHGEFQSELRRAVDDWLIVGHGWLKIGYRYEESEQPIPDHEQAAQYHDMVAQADEYAQQNPHLAGDMPTNDDIQQSIPTTESVTVKDTPFLERVSFSDVFVDPEATAISDLKWIAQRVVRPFEEVKNDKRYSQGVRSRLKPDGAVNREWFRGHQDDVEKTDVVRITLWEFYDLQRKEICLYSELGDDFLITPKPLPYTYGMPFVMLRNYDVPDRFYPIGELENIEAVQLELNKTRSQMVNYRKKDARKHLYRAEAFDQAGITALTSDKDGTMVPVTSDEPFTNVIAALPQGNPFIAEMYRFSDTIEADIDRVSGVTEYQRGSVAETRKTATEAAIVEDHANSRSADKLQTVEHVIAECAERLVQLAQQYMTGEQVARVVGKDGTKLWVPFSRDDISGEFDFEVEAGSTQPQNDSFKRQQALQMLQVLQPFVGPVLDPKTLLLHVLREGFGIQNPEKFMAQQDPNAQKPPMEKLIEMMSYKDVPPDIQRQMEEQAGFTPSHLGALPTSALEPDAHRMQLENQVGLNPPPDQQPAKKAA